MASADPRAELKCSVCQNIYTDPVKLQCGHNFCRVCIDRVLNKQEGSGDYICPECSKRFRSRPELQENITLRNKVKNFLSAHPDQRIVCTYCTYLLKFPIVAVKSCLHCEAYLCYEHMRAHDQASEHVISDLATSPQFQKCSIHEELLKYYCIRDSIRTCASCSLVGEHRGHQVETIYEAYEKKKETLRNVRQKLSTQRDETEKRVQSLQEHRRKVEEEAAGDTERVTVLFRDLRRRLEDLEKRVLREISGRAERISIFIRDLEIKKEELSRKLRHIEELCNMTDPLTVLQESDTDMNGRVFLFHKDKHTDHVSLAPNITKPLEKFSVCLYLFRDFLRNLILFSLASPGTGNAFYFLDSSSSNAIHTDQDSALFRTNMEPYEWKHACVTWDSDTGVVQLWVNGKLYPRRVCMKGSSIPAETSMVLGQKKDSFQQRPASYPFVGEISDLHMWDYVLTPEEMLRALNKNAHGNVINWNSLIYDIKGDILVLPKSRCPYQVTSKSCK